MGLTKLLDLGQTVSHAEETLDIDRAYLEIPALQNLTLAETLANRWQDIYGAIPFGRLRQRPSGESGGDRSVDRIGVRSFMIKTTHL
jgi:hypothetical protein